jgi:hypothetical protein
LIAARALLTLVAEGEDTLLFEHIDACADNAALLSNLLRALSAAAEESPDRALTARRIWPTVISHVIGLQESGHTPFEKRHYGNYALAGLIPNPAGEVSYLCREVDNEPIVW